jgi:hypothetical protein
MTKLSLTVACPEADRDDATHLGVALGWIEGWAPDEWMHAFTARRQDASGNLYRVMSMPVRASFVARAVMMGPIERPEQDVEPYVVNMTGAHRAQDKLSIWQPAAPDPETGEMPDNPVPLADPSRIVAVVGMPGRQAIEAMGLLSLDLLDEPEP